MCALVASTVFLSACLLTYLMDNPVLPATGAAAADEEEKQQRLLAGLPILTHTRANRK